MKGVRRMHPMIILYLLVFMGNLSLGFSTHSMKTLKLFFPNLFCELESLATQ